MLNFVSFILIFVAVYTKVLHTGWTLILFFPANTAYILLPWNLAVVKFSHNYFFELKALEPF